MGSKDVFPALVTVVADDAEHVVIALHGEMDAYSQREMYLQLLDVSKDVKPSAYVLALDDVDICDSSGLALLFRFNKLVSAAGGTLALTGVRSRIARMFDIAGVGGEIPFEVAADGR